MPIDSKDLERIIRRIDMNRGQTTLLKYLYEAGDEFVNRDELIEKIRWGDAKSFTGVLAAFANRINNTEGISGSPGYEAFIERKNIDGDEHFRLRSKAREAIENVPELMDVFERPMDELLEGVIVDMKEPMSERLERILELWKVVVEKNLKFEHLNLEEAEYRNKRTKELAKQFLDNPTKKNFLDFWSDEIIYSAKRTGSGRKVYEKWRAENRSIDELASFIREVKESENYDESWEDDFPGRKTLWELFGLLHIDEHPPINNTSRDGLEFFGYSYERHYPKLEENYLDFEEKYLDIVGYASKEAPYEAPLYLEIDKLFNLVTKVKLQDLKDIEDEDARELLKYILIQRMLNNNLTDHIKKYSEVHNSGQFHDKDEKWEAWKFDHGEYFEKNIKGKFDLLNLEPSEVEDLFEAIEADDVISSTIPPYLIGGRSGGIAWRDFKEKSLENPVESSRVISKLLNEDINLKERLVEFEEFYSDIDASGGPTLGLATYFLMYTYPDQYIFYKYSEFKAFFEEYLDEKVSTGFNPEEYKIILGILGEIKSELSSYIDSPDMVDVHNLIYCQGKDYIEKEDEIDEVSVKMEEGEERITEETQILKDVNFWQIAPGKRKYELWNTLSENNLIVIDWGYLGELGEKEEIFSKFDKEDPWNARSCNIFANEFEEGDIVVAKKGRSKEIYGLGVVSGDYFYDVGKAVELFGEERDNYAHFRPVNWVLDFVKDYGERLKVENLDRRFVVHTAHSLGDGQERYQKIKEELVNKHPELESKFTELERFSNEIRKTTTEEPIEDILDEMFLSKEDEENAREYFVKLFEYLDFPDKKSTLLNTNYSSSGKVITVNYGHWQVFNIKRKGDVYLGLFIADLSLLPEDYEEWLEYQGKLGEFSDTKDFRLIRFEWDEDLFERYPKLEDAWKSGLEYTKDKFQSWESSPYQKYHHEGIYDWIMGDIETLDTGETNYFWITANPKIWNVSKIKDGGTEFYTAYNKRGNKRRIFDAFEKAKPGDKVIFYESTPVKKIVAEGEITKGMHYEEEEGFDELVEGIRVKYSKPLNNITWLQLKDIPDLEDSKPISNGAQGSLFELTKKEFETILALEPEPEVEEIDKGEILLEIHSSDLDIGEFDLDDDLYFPSGVWDEIQMSIASALRSGKNIIFTGPPGTGKTKIAKKVAEHIKDKNEWKEDFIFTTATADWTTFDTIGGYYPSKEGDGLEFKPGLFLSCFKDTKGMPINKWLIIDEINRADIDKAFGQLFSVLSNDSVELPFNDDEENQISIVSLDSEDDLEYDESSFYVTQNWRLLATMNSYDKSSLYEMSYAFMRRFAFIDVGVPSSDELDMGLMKDYIECWDDVEDVEDEDVEKVLDIWRTLIDNNRAIGPAIIKDILGFVSANGEILTALKLFVLPQFEGMVRSNQREIIEALGKCGVDKQKLYNVARERFDLELKEDE